MSLRALGVNTDEDSVNRVMGAQPLRGASWDDAASCAQYYGMRATLVVPSTIKMLKSYTDRKVPVMIAWNPEGRPWSHASVVFDVDDNFNVHVADPNIPDPEETVRVVPKQEFYKKWIEPVGERLVIRRPAMAIEREITEDGHQVIARGRSMMETYPAIHPKVVEMMRIAAPQVSKQDVEKALRSAGLKFTYTSEDGGSFLISDLGPKLTDAADISLDTQGKKPQDATGWVYNHKAETRRIQTRNDLTRIVKHLLDEYQKSKKTGSENTMSTDFADKWGDILPGTKRVLARQDKESKFERGEDVPLHELPDELQDNVKDPPPSVHKLKEKLKEKGDKGGEEAQSKEAARAPSGLYGYTKQVQGSCEIASRRLHRIALQIAKGAVAKDGRVADFWAARAKRAKSRTARMLLAALQASQKLASENGLPLEVGKEAAKKEASYGYYGFPVRTARRGLTACQALKEEAGVIAATLHSRKAALHEKITGFFQEHSKHTKCGACRMLLDAYPDQDIMRLASLPDDDDVNGWLAWED